MGLMIESNVERHENSLVNNSGKMVKPELPAVIKPKE
jgi:hypothetical protein